MMKRQLLSIFLLFCLISQVFGQNHDSLSQKSNRYLVEKLNSFEFKRQDPLVWIYLDAYINNAKRKKDYETLFYGYRTAIYFSNEKQKILYSDSAVLAGKQTNNSDILGKAYYSRGSTFYESRKYRSTLDNYIRAYEVLEESKDEFTKNQVKYGISVVKLYLGYYNDALNLIQAPLEYFRNQSTSDGNLFYIRSLFRKGEAFQALKEYNKAREVNLLGLQEAIKFNEKIQEQYFNLAIGIDDYFAKNYALTIQNIEKALPIMKENGYFELEQKGNFYIAKSYLALKQEEKALSHFRKVDSLFIKNNYLPNELREAHEWLIGYYKRKDNKDQQLYYINQLLKVDKINAENNQYLAHKIHKEYDTQKLLEEKNKLESQFNYWFFIAIIVLSIILLVALIYFGKYRRVQKQNQTLHKQYEELLRQTKKSTLVSVLHQPKKTVKEMSEEMVEDILKRLELFEQKQEFLNKNIDLKFLATKFNTNTTYLSKVINSYKETNFNGYLNRLRIYYIIDLLKKEPKYRNYTIEALGDAAGFATPRHFSDTFFTETNLRPTYFLEQIRKEENEVLG